MPTPFHLPMQHSKSVSHHLCSPSTVGTPTFHPTTSTSSFFGPPVACSVHFHFHSPYSISYITFLSQHTFNTHVCYNEPRPHKSTLRHAPQLVHPTMTCPKSSHSNRSVGARDTRGTSSHSQGLESHPESQSNRSVGASDTRGT